MCLLIWGDMKFTPPSIKDSCQKKVEPQSKQAFRAKFQLLENTEAKEEALTLEWGVSYKINDLFCYFQQINVEKSKKNTYKKKTLIWNVSL